MNETVGFLLFDKFEELDVVGPWEMMSLWCKDFAGPNHICTISEKGGLIAANKGLRIHADFAFKECPKLDYLFIPGGMGTRGEVNNKTVIEFIQHQAKNCKVIASICTGSFLLQAAGLLSDKKATTHWQSLERLKKFPEVNVTEKRFVRDGNIWTSAGISAGIDMTLALIADIAGKETAGKIQLQAEYFPNNEMYLDLDKTENLPEYLKDDIFPDVVV